MSKAQRLTTWLLALLLASGGPLAAQDDPFVRCTKCKNTGARHCPEHDDDDCELEGNAIYCSVIGLCSTCGGTGWVDCPHCENVAVQERLATKRELIPSLAEGVSYFEVELGRPLMVAESPHFVLVWDVEKMKVGKKLVAGHDLLHRYVDHLERLYSDYASILQVEDSAFEKKSRVLVWSNFDQHREASLRYCRMAAHAGVRLMGAEPTYSVPAVKKLFANEELLRRNIVHCATHLLLSHQRPSHWMGKSKGGWADAGLAHWFEYRYFEICDNYCYQESDTAAGVRAGNWKPLVRKLVAKDEAPSLAGLFQQNTESLSLDQHCIAFSLIDYLIALDGKQLDRLLIRLRQKVPTRDALAEIYEINPIQLQQTWRDWVLANYPAR